MAVNNSIKVSKLVSKKLAGTLSNGWKKPLPLKVSKYVGRELVKDGFKVGESFEMVVPTVATAEDGLELKEINSYVEDTVLMNIETTHQAFELDIKEMTFYLNPNTPDTLGFGNEQRIKAIYARINRKIHEKALTASNTIPVNASDKTSSRWMMARNKIISAGVAEPGTDLFAMISPETTMKLVEENKLVFNDQSAIAKQYMEAEMARAFGWNFSTDTSVVTWTYSSGVDDPIVINGADQTGTKLKVSGLAEGHEIKVNENFYIDGVEEVDENEKNKTGGRKYFVVDAVSADGTELTVWPPIVKDGQFQNVSNAPANGAKLNFAGTAGKTVSMDIGFYKPAILYVPIDAHLYSRLAGAESYVETDKKTGDSYMFTYDGNIMNMKNIFRVDIFYAVGVLRRDWVVKVPSELPSY